jgi:hypothetical protein
MATVFVVAESYDPNLGSEIDAYLAGKNSPIAGDGSVFFSKGVQYNVDPRLIVAISGAESSFGTNWGACPSSGFNAWSYFYNGNCANSPFSSYAEGITVVTKFIRRTDLNNGYTTVALIQSHTTSSGGTSGYCTSGCQNWIPDVTQFYLQLHGDAVYGADGSLTNLTFSNSAPLGQGSIVYSNLRTDGSYDSTLNWVFGDEQSLNRVVSIAFPFSPTTTGRLAKIDVGLAPQNQGGTVQVELRSDADGAPGDLIESWSTTLPQTGTASAPLTTITSVQYPMLSSLTTYWLVATSNTNSGSGAWYTVSGDYTFINRSINNGQWSSVKTLRGALRVYGNTVSQ